MLVNKNAPFFSTILFKRIGHFYLPTCTRAPSYIFTQCLKQKTHPHTGKAVEPGSYTHPPSWGSRGAIAHPQIWEAMEPMPIATQGKPWSHCPSPTILPLYMLVNKNDPSFSTILFKRIRHFYLPTCTWAPHTQPKTRTHPHTGKAVEPGSYAPSTPANNPFPT